MNSLSVLPDLSAGALARAGLYRLMALGFAYPSADVTGEFRRVLGLHHATEPRGHDLRPQLDALAGVVGVPGDLVAEFTRLFDRTVACSPYESDNVGGMRAFTKSRDLADVQGFYKAFGLELGPDAAEMGDHIRVELEFGATLALKEAYFREEGDAEALDITVDAEKAFMRDHLGRWVPAFCDRLVAATGDPFYAALGAATKALVEAELVMLGVEPQPLASPVPDEAGGPGADQLICPQA